MKIIDMHHHFFSKNTIKAFEKMLGPKVIEEFKKQIDYSQRISQFQNLKSPVEQAQILRKDMKRKGIDQVLLMAFTYDAESAFEAHQSYPESFPGVIPFLNPEIDRDSNILLEWKEKGAVGVKFYPGMWNKMRFSDDSLFPYLKKIEELDLVPLIHFGVMKGATQRNWPINPLELKPWLQRTDLNLNFVIAHFGAGYLREILLMAYSYGKKIYVDTSGSNDWIFWSPWQDLTYVFEKTIKALGSDHVLFGTDSGLNLLRKDVIDRQLGILTDLMAKKIITLEDKAKILGLNAKELFGI